MAISRLRVGGRSPRVAAAVALTSAALVVACKREAAPKPDAQAAAVAKRRVAPKKLGPRVPRHLVFPSAKAAVASILATHRPRVLGFGEVHQKTDSAPVRSAVKRFAMDLLPSLAPKATDLLVETWVTQGRCGKQEKRVVKQVEATTKRPQSTENEVLGLLRRGRGLGLKPHILVLSCADYAKLSGKDGKVDYEALLSTVTRHLQKKVLAILGGKDRAGKRAKRRAAKERTVLVYGGALHNDLFPQKDLAMFTYAPAAKRAAKGRYVEVDLYVPEYLLGDKDARKKPWFPLLGKATPEQVVLVERGEGSYVLILRRGIAAKKTGGKGKGKAKGREARGAKG